MKVWPLYNNRLVFLFKNNIELADHFHLHCEVVKAIWDEIFTRRGIAWVMPRRLVDLL